MDSSSSDIGPPTEYVSCDEIRQIFADGAYFERFERGEFQTFVKRQGPPLTRKGEKFGRGIQRQVIEYREPGVGVVAWVHQRAGDEFGNPAPGVWTDPKFLFHEGVRYVFKTHACTREVCICQKPHGR